MGVRQERRAAIEADIIRVARQHLAKYGAAGLSLRSVAKELGMVSSGIYRYVASRDDLLTRLIVRAYTSLAEAAASAHSAVPAEDLDGRWNAIGRAMREWALANPHDFALIYGSPVPDYAAPGELTIGPGTAVQGMLVRLLDDAARAGRMPDPAPDGLPGRAVGDLLTDDMFAGLEVDAQSLARGLSAWTLLLGAVTSELFHQLGPLEDPGALFEWHLARARDLVLRPAADRSRPSTVPSTAVYTARPSGDPARS